jgi:CPA2 family monovalent cation:H+ antiporter-2
MQRLNNPIFAQYASKVGDNPWKSLLLSLFRITVIYSILSVAIVLEIFSFALPLAKLVMPERVADIVVGILTILAVSPFLRAIMMKKNHSEEVKTLWKVNKMNRFLIILTVLVRVLLASLFVYYILAYLFHFTHAIEIVITFVLVILMISSRRLKRSSIRLERMFILNLRSRDIEAQVHGHKRPLYEGHLLDRDIHITDVELPENTIWAGMSLRELQFGTRFGIHVSSILRGRQRINIPGAETVLFPGDRVQVIGSDDQLTAFSRSATDALVPEDPDVEKREMHLSQMIITGSSPFIGKKLSESGIREEYGCLVVGFEEGKETLSHPDPNHVFQKGDLVWVVAEKDSLNRLNKNAK